MADTIESFVAKLQTEGVQAGEQVAEKLRQEAQQQADKIIADANEQAEKIIAGAKTEAQSTLERGRTELGLASRDIVLALRETLGRALNAVLAAGAREKLTDSEFLADVLREIILTYARGDVENRQIMKINVPSDLRQKLADWAMGVIAQEKLEGLKTSIDLKGTLTEAGFEYTVQGATVEVTESSVVEALTDLVSPALRELLDKAASKDCDEADCKEGGCEEGGCSTANGRDADVEPAVRQVD